MAKVTVIGWYGTETIGDRAILSGLIQLISQVLDDFDLALGVLFEPLSERTLIEDGDFLKRISTNHLQKIKIFSSLNRGQLEKNIAESDIVIVGGGPLMDISVMYMLEYAFGYAKRKKIPTMLAGCGWGPLNNPKIIKSALRLIKYSDSIVFRDKMSQDEYLSACRNINESIVETHHSIDPAFFTASYFASLQTNRQEDIITVNFRDAALDKVYAKKDETIETYFKGILEELLPYEKKILLLPMHTFHLGGDDRVFLNKLAKDINNPLIEVQHNPLSLEETMNQYYNSFLCVGMRFHSIVLQIVLNGRNYLLDYTHPQKGKTIGMLTELDLLDKYKNRYASLEKRENLTFDANCPRIELPANMFDSYKSVYVNQFRKILSR
jgi:polysaccharide pyruvyl transferase WcaK-like protein